MQAATQEADFTLDSVFVPPGGVHPRWHQANDKRAPLGLLVGFGHPVADGASVGRIHEASAAPGLGQAIILLGVEPLTKGTFRRTAGIESKTAKLAAQFLE